MNEKDYLSCLEDYHQLLPFLFSIIFLVIIIKIKKTITKNEFNFKLLSKFKIVMLLEGVTLFISSSRLILSTALFNIFLEHIMHQDLEKQRSAVSIKKTFAL